MSEQSIHAAPGYGASEWTWHLGALAALVGLILAVFHFEVTNAVEAWWIYPTYSHCFLIVPISAWLIWEKRAELKNQTPTLALKALAFLPAVLLFWLVARFATVNEARQLAVVGLIQIAAVTMLGWSIYRTVLFPLLFLFFLVPTGQYFVPPMQEFATRFTDTGLGILGVPHFTEGTLIELSNGRFEVAEACAGLRFLIATVTLGILFAHLNYRRWWKIGVFLAACVVVPLIGNGFRCLGIIMLAYMTNNQIAVGADHLVYGWIFNMAILLFLFVVGLKFRDPTPEEETPERGFVQASSHAAVVTLAAATALAICTVPAFAFWYESRPIVANAAAFERPMAPPGWTVVPFSGRWHPDFVAPDAQFAMSMEKTAANAPAVDVAVEYYGRMRAGHSLIASTNSPWDNAVWHLIDERSITERLGDKNVLLSEATITAPGERRLVWSAYWLDERFTISPLAIKLLQLKTVVAGNESAALIAISTPVDGAVEDARERLKEALQSLDQLPNRLIEAGLPADTRKASN